MSATDQTRAVQALAYRLRDWGVPDADEKAHEFITALVSVGWEMGQRGARPPINPKPHEACRDCGKHHDACLCDGGPTLRVVMPLPDAAPRVERLRVIRAEIAADLCGHGVPRTNCLDHRTPSTTPGPTQGASA